MEGRGSDGEGRRKGAGRDVPLLHKVDGLMLRGSCKLLTWNISFKYLSGYLKHGEGHIPSKLSVVT
jgi:hypothetical protein